MKLRRGALPKTITACLVGLITLLATTSTAYAHAALESSTPSDGARLKTAPTTIDLAFSEKVTVDPGSIRVTNTNGERVDKGGVSFWSKAGEV